MKIARNKKVAKKIPKKKPVAAKKSFDFKSFWANVNSLNKDNYGSAPLIVRLFIIAVLIVFLLALAWFLLIKPKLEEIKSAEANQETLLSTYQEKEAKARYLDEYKDQIAQMEAEFSQLLNQLPKDTRISELIENVNLVGSGSGIRFKDISVNDEIEQEFFIEQPIDITALGEYHQFGDFVTGISRLSRIITMHDFEVVNQQPNLDTMPQLQLILHTKTYRAKDEVDISAQGDVSENDAASEGGNP